MGSAIELLPRDVQNIIVGFLGTLDLLSLGSTSKKFIDIAIKRLGSSIKLSKDESCSPLGGRVTALKLLGNSATDQELRRIPTLCPSLRTLNLFGAKTVIDLSPLAKLSMLERLELSFSKISDLSPLKDLPCLGKINAIQSGVKRKNLPTFASGCQVITHAKPVKETPLSELTTKPLNGKKLKPLPPHLR